MKLTQKIIPTCLILLSPIVCVQAQTADPQAADPAAVTPDAASQRTVMNTEYGSIFAAPNGFPYSDFGAYIGAGRYSTNLNPDAIKGHYSHFNHFGPADAALGFPYAALRAYEASEVRARRPPIFVTATYQGKKRPVMFMTYLKLNGSGHPTAPQSQWVYAVNTGDSRFINWWINNYARPVVLNPMAHLGNAWVYLDGCTFLYSAYGVLDNSGRFVGGVPWDSPFPSNANTYMNSIATFFNTLKKIAPDIKVLTDTGSMSDPTQFSKVYASVPGMLDENVYEWHSGPTAYTLNKWVTTIFPWYSWAGAQGRVGIMGAFLPSNYESGALLTSFVTYELLKGVNFFFAPRVGGTSIPLNAGWMSWTSKLGNPVGLYKSSDGNRFFSRQYNNGYVYLNWTGRTQTVTLPSGSWLDPHGNRVTRLSIPTWTGTFVNR